MSPTDPTGQAARACGRNLSPANSSSVVIVHGPPASGKTLNCAALGAHYGCRVIIDDGLLPGSEKHLEHARAQDHRVLVTCPTLELDALVRKLTARGFPVLVVSVGTAAAELGERWRWPAKQSAKARLGILPDLPLRNFPPGRVRLRMRHNDWPKAYVRDESGIREFIVAEDEGAIVPVYECEQGCNRVREVEPQPVEVAPTRMTVDQIHDLRMDREALRKMREKIESQEVPAAIHERELAGIRDAQAKRLAEKITQEIIDSGFLE